MTVFELDGLHRDYDREVRERYARLSVLYPRSRLRAVRTYRKAGDESIAYEAAGEIHLNLFWFGRSGDHLRLAGERGHRHGVSGVAAWHDGMVREPAHVLTHEFGHVLARDLPGYQEFASQGHAAALGDPKLAATGYCLVDSPDEWFAETFAAGLLGDVRAMRNSQVRALRRFLLT